MREELRPQESGCAWGWGRFLCLLVAQLWAAHACVFFAHEYAHSFAAWALGWKANPLALDYGHPTLTVLLIQLGIDQTWMNCRSLPVIMGRRRP